MLRSDDPDRLIAATNVSQCSYRSTIANRDLSLKQLSGSNNIQFDSNFGGSKPDDDDHERTDCAYDLNQSKCTKDFNQSECTVDLKHLRPRSLKCSLYRGYIYASLSGALYLLSNAIAKYVKNVSPVEIAMFRFFGTFVFSLPFVIRSRENPFGPRNARHLIFFSSLFATTNIVLKFISLKYLPLGDATIISLSMPVLTTVLAKIFLKEPCGYFQSFTVLLTFVGLILISKVFSIGGKTNSGYTIKEYVFGFGGAIGGVIPHSLLYIFLRKIANINSSIIWMNIALIAIIETFALTLLTDEFKIPMCGLEQWLIAMLGIFGFLAPIFMTISLKEENAGTVAIIRVGTDIVLAFIFQILFFNEIPDKYSISGAVLICSALLLINANKYFST